MVKTVGASGKLHGVLFGRRNELNYLSLDDGKILFLDRVGALIRDILVSKSNDVYYSYGSLGREYGIKSLSGFEFLRKNAGNLHESNGSIFDVSYGGMVDVLEKRVLITRGDLYDKFQIDVIYSLASDRDGNLYGLVDNGDEFVERGGSYFSLVTIDINRGRYTVGKRIFDYSEDCMGVEQAFILPYASLNGLDGEKYPFSVISCSKEIDGESLLLNDERIDWTREEKGFVARIKPVRLMEGRLDMVCSGFMVEGDNEDDPGPEQGWLIGINIDLGKKSVCEETTLVRGILSPDPRKDSVNALEPVTNEGLHQKLIGSYNPYVSTQ